MSIVLEKLSAELNTNSPLIIAGPCSAESQQQLLSTAYSLKEIGIKIFRAGIWKPRTRPNSFEGVGEIGLEWLKNVSLETNMKIMTEVANPNHLDDILKNDIDMIWIGARTAGNPFAVQEIANALKGVDIPVFVKNPLNEDLNLWIGAIERLKDIGIHDIAQIQVINLLRSNIIKDDDATLYDAINYVKCNQNSRQQSNELGARQSAMQSQGKHKLEDLISHKMLRDT